MTHGYGDDMNALTKRDLGAERRGEILQAFIRCIGQFGLDKSSMHRIAAEAGVSQPLLMHHFGSRDGLLKALIELAVNQYRAGFEKSLEDTSSDPEVLLRFLFGGEIVKAMGETDVVFPELYAQAGRDPGLRKTLRELFRGFIEDIVDVLRALFPRANQADIQCVAYGLVALREGDDMISKLTSGKPSINAMDCGRALMATLGSAK